MAAPANLEEDFRIVRRTVAEFLLDDPWVCLKMGSTSEIAMTSRENMGK